MIDNVNEFSFFNNEYFQCSFVRIVRKDDICFRRKRVKNAELRDAITQSKISCKPFLQYELKSVENDSNENHKNHTTTNPFSSKSKENHEIKANHHLRNLDKNSSHRHQSSRHQDVEHSSQDDRSLRSKHNNHRPKESERREQNDVERTKRRRSPSVSKDHKRMRRSRSRSRDHAKRDRERNVAERSSPDKVSRSLVCDFNEFPGIFITNMHFAHIYFELFIHSLSKFTEIERQN